MSKDEQAKNPDWTSMDDEILVRAHLKGDKKAFQVLFRKYQEMVSRLALSILKDESNVEDVVQDVFVLVFRNLPKFRGDSSFKTWIYRISVNESLRRLNRSKRWVTVEDPEQEAQKNPSTMVILNPGGASPERLVFEGEQKEIVHNALEALKPSHRIALTLFYLEDLDVKEISDVLEIPEGSVKSRLFYAREALKKALEPVVGQARNIGKENHVL